MLDGPVGIWNHGWNTSEETIAEVQARYEKAHIKVLT